MGKEYVVANDLTGVWLNGQEKWLWAKDENGDAVSPSYNTQSLPVPEFAVDRDYDQSNWVQLILDEPANGSESIQGHLLLGHTIIGELTDCVNPTIVLRAHPIPTTAAPYTPNTYLPANFVEQPEYFMVEPKPQEYVNIEMAVCREQINDTTFVMAIPMSDGDYNSENLSGAFLATVKNGFWEDMSSFNPESSIRKNYGYQLTGIVRSVVPDQLTTFKPDGAEHSPVSDKWELYVISATESMSPVIVGDANDDGTVSIADVSTIIDYLLGLDPEPFNEVNADINGGGITIADVSALIDILLGIAK